jgi:hypothetical protein
MFIVLGDISTSIFNWRSELLGDVYASNTWGFNEMKKWDLNWYNNSIEQSSVQKSYLACRLTTNRTLQLGNSSNKKTKPLLMRLINLNLSEKRK